MSGLNVLGAELEPCGVDPLTGFYRDGCCTSGPEDVGSHTVCAVMTADFLAHQRSIGNDLSTPMPMYRFPGLLPGDRWCVTAEVDLALLLISTFIAEFSERMAPEMLNRLAKKAEEKV